MAKATTVKVSNRYQISLPSVARKELSIEAGDRLLVDIQEGMIILLPQPTNYADALGGLHQDIWQDIDSTAYLERERDAWSQASNKN